MSYTFMKAVDLQCDKCNRCEVISGSTHRECVDRAAFWGWQFGPDPKQVTCKDCANPIKERNPCASSGSASC